MKKHLARYFFVLTLLLVHGLSIAQTSTTTNTAAPKPAETDNTSQQSITLTKIADQALTTQRLIEKLKPIVAQPLEFEELNDKLLQFKQQLSSLQTQTTSIINDRKSSIDQIRATQSQWKFFKDQLTKHQQKVRERSSELESAIAELTSDEANWKQTQSQIKSTPDLNYDGASLKTSTTAISSLRKQLSITLQEAITLEQEWQELIDLCDDSQASLKNDESYLQSNLLKNIQQPIWALQISDFSTDKSATQSLDLQNKLLSHYGTRYLKRLQIIVILLIGFVFFLHQLRIYNLKTYQNHTGIRLKLPLLERPFSAFIAVTIFWALVLLPSPPPILKGLLLLSLIIPITRLGIPSLPNSEKPLAWLVTVFFVLTELSALTTTIPALQRLWGLFCAAAGLLGCIYVLARTSKIEGKKSSFWKALRLSLWLALFTALIAMLGNIFGAIVLSQFLITGIAYATFTGLSLVVFAGILNDMAVAAIYMPTSEISHLISSNRSLLIRYFKKLITIIFSIFWVYFTLSQFALWDSIIALCTALLSKSFSAGSISVSVGDFLSVAVTIWLSFKISQLLRFILIEDIAPRTNMVRGVPEAIGTLSHYFIVLVGFFIAVSLTGIDVSKLAIMAGALGVGIGIGLQDVVNNFTSGLILLFEQNIKQADTIQCGSINGQVMHIGLRCSIIRTFDGAEVIVPNGKLASEQVINWTRSSQERRITIPISTTQSADANKVIETLLQVAKNNRDIIDTPPAIALLLGFGAGTMNFELRAWVNSSESIGEINSKLCAAIAKAFADAGILIPFPQQDIYIKQIPTTSQSL
ncbi:MAG: mechanosensitive ion channel [Pseudomonadales bacterium]